MERKIHIHAESKVYSVFELVSEKNAVKRLEEIREGFMYMNNKHGYKDDRLKVSTHVVNPELPFKKNF